jgi:hypothetical protein
MMTITVHPAQARLLAEAEQAKQAATARAHDMLNILCAGLVPDGATLTGIDATTGVLTFHVAPEVPHAE